MNLTKIKLIKSDTAIQIFEYLNIGCKNHIEREVFSFNIPFLSECKKIEHHSFTKTELFSIHGNVLYKVNYRSYIDTPFMENDIIQHSIQTRMNIVFKEKYPATVFLTSRRSNSSYFSNATDISIQFRQNEMLENIKKKMRTDVDSVLLDKSLSLTPLQIYQFENGIDGNLGKSIFSEVPEVSGSLLEERRKAIKEKTRKLYEKYKAQMDSFLVFQKFTQRLPGAQEIVEEKERKLRSEKNGNEDSIKNKFLSSGNGLINEFGNKINNANEYLDNKKHKADSLKIEIAKTEKEFKSFQKKIKDSIQDLRKQIGAISNRDGLISYLQKTEQSSNSLSGIQKALLSIRQIGIGRTWIDYSELTVKNISLNGFNVEANPGKVYLAAAAGKVNYRFRDYIVKGNYAGSNQSVGLIRLGFGKKDGNNVIVTYYSGKKALLNQISSADSGSVQNISGISIETRGSLDANNYLIAEYARSTTPAFKGKIFDLKDHSNEAFSLKLFTHYGNTKVTSYYRRSGENFQSFTMFPSNSKQDAWMVKASQTIFKNRIIIDASIRKNDFTSPIALPDFSNSNVFKSIQITERIPKYPFVSVGFYPSSQLTLGNNNVLYENRYNTLNAIISHSYNYKSLSMNTNATYMRFYNSGIDTGFIYFNSTTFSLNHSINLSKFIFQGTLSITDQSGLKQFILEPGLTYQVKNKITVSGSLRWSNINHTETLWGGTAGLNLYLKKAGILQLRYDKLYLPGYNRNLLPVDIGKLTFSREF